MFPIENKSSSFCVQKYLAGESLLYTVLKESRALSSAFRTPGGGVVSDRRRFGHVNVVCIYSISVLAGKGGMGAGIEWEGLKMGQYSGQETRYSRMRIHNHLRKASILSKGFSLGRVSNPEETL
jgi:hypothetical protein